MNDRQRCEWREMLLAFDLRWRLSASMVLALLEVCQGDWCVLRTWAQEHTLEDLGKLMAWEPRQSQTQERLAVFFVWLQNLEIEEVRQGNVQCHAWEATHSGCLTTQVDLGYPARFHVLAAPPITLWWSRPPTYRTETVIAVVGSRDMTEYGALATRHLVSGFVSSQATIVSGCALGIDTVAHEEAIENGLDTVGFLACGLQNVPERVARLFSKGGWFVSEFPPRYQGARWNFEQRNRLIAGLSQATVVVEAKFQSGTWITARAAVDQGKEVFVMTQPLTSSHSATTLALINDGAKVVGSAADVLACLRQEKRSTAGDTSLRDQVLVQGSTKEEKQFLAWLWSRQGKCLFGEWESVFPGRQKQDWSILLAVLEARGVITRQAGVVILSCMIQS